MSIGCCTGISLDSLRNKYNLKYDSYWELHQPFLFSSVWKFDRYLVFKNNQVGRSLLAHGMPFRIQSVQY